ncbi:nitroreductase family protein [Hazenella sp. IB182357]|uniref:Nitroreductase family protein n=1 Tax=Polycladospora coralii TaxID=2771432 RepID=A0A926NC06_9BACL|nr:nitroreductase family protein [Polycladospora coralii]MBD1370779.1 nitroreductase family protein [Polycladospora coralii]MBS7529717.1 nitroreductase family protein [Polycladospora coralii]
MSTAIEAMQERRSVKRYEDYVIPEQDLQDILAAAASAPSSWNLQHWRYLVITSKEMKEKILPIAYNQQQVVEASATIVMLGDLEANKTGTELFGYAVQQGMLTQEIHDSLLGQINGVYQIPQIARDEAILNTSLSAMQLMLAAKEKGYDTCPMGGFDKEAIVKALNIPDRYIPVMLITVGKAAEPARPAGRLPLERLVINESF